MEEKLMNRIIYIQDAIDALMKRDKELRSLDWSKYPHADYECLGIDEALDIICGLPPAQPDHSDEVKFWKERAEFYGKTCIDLLNDISKSVKINSIEVNENGIIFTKEQKRSCDGCKHLGMWENEIEYGYPYPCLRCVRRAGDNYE